MKIEFVLLLVLVLLSLTLFVYVRWLEPGKIRLREETISLPGAATLRILFFSDTHIGRFFPQARTKEIVEGINAQQADLILFGGDLIDWYDRDQERIDPNKLAGELSKLKAPYGKFAVLGNHDYVNGAELIVPQILEEAGFIILKNEKIILSNGLTLIGYDDLLYGEHDRELEKIEEQALILSHEPDRVDRIEAARPGIFLSGHSHGGQVSLPLLTRLMLPNGAKRYPRANGKKTGIRQNIALFVTNGIGMTGLPFRFLAPPEILSLNLTGKHVEKPGC